MAKDIPVRRPSRLIPAPPASGHLSGQAFEVILQPPANTSVGRVVEPPPPAEGNTRGGGSAA